MITSPNGFRGEVNAQEAVSIVSLILLSHFSFVTHEKGHQDDCERISACFHQLRDFFNIIP
ncbi:hypothetical protein HMPREF1565_0989 [Providencia alcalifaciens RIMD 1656011]|uniref:Uncharacterized protein n=2 Tax=Providencia alcalifaciens TaxID=126385 RepID=A0AAV3M796_9GAMM|nr:hypothetical protein HMPREF1565_0989 [Providencia alcalifaciens RIMD 1656011]EUD11748.1 hypothetical protein HMPREF1563_0345 [Providencia alcalifaciens 205/92]